MSIIRVGQKKVKADIFLNYTGFLVFLRGAAINSQFSPLVWGQLHATLRHYEVGLEECPKREDLGEVVSAEPVAQNRSVQ
jgi:hypothetical protein